VIVFAKAPVPGTVKTRLAPALGPWRAARLHAILVERALKTALAARVGCVELHVAPRRGNGFFRFLQERTGVPVLEQRGASLGERMATAFERSLRRHRFVVLMGSDCPALHAADLRRAVRLLRGPADVVLAPAEDGGYVLIGLRRPRPRLFEAIAWGEASVFESTVRRIEAQRLALRTLRTLWDVDRPQDLERLRALRHRAGSRRSVRR
jgi:rSAM/selenodomain-associated transferase 1